MLAIWVRGMERRIFDILPKKTFGIALIFSSVLFIFSTLLYLFTRTPNVVAIIVVSLITYTNTLTALFVWSEKLRRNSLPYIVLLIILVAVSVGMLVFEIYYLLARKFVAEIVEPGYATLGLLILLILGYFANQIVEKITPELYWRVGRFLGEDYINVVYVSAFAMIGPAIAFFGVTSLDPYMGFLTLLIAFMPIPGKIRNIRMYLRREEIAKTMEETTRKWLLSIPAIKDVPEIKVYSLGPLAFAEFRVMVSELIRDRLEVLGDSIRVPIVDMIGNLVGIHAYLSTTRDTQVLVGIPAEDSKVSSRLAGKCVVVRVDLSKLEVIGTERVELSDLKEEDEILRSLISKRLDVLCLREVDKKIKNYLDGWFIIPMQIESDTVDAAQKELIENLRKLIE